MGKVIKRTFSLTLACVIIAVSVMTGNMLKADAADYSGWAAVFDPAYYVASNKDAANYAKGNVDRLWQYFTSVGIPKGDQASEEFNVFIYAKNYPQLRAAFGDNMVQYYIHYATAGKAQGLNARTLNTGTQQNQTQQVNTAGLNGITNIPAYFSSDLYKEYERNLKAHNESFVLNSSFNEVNSLINACNGRSIDTAAGESISQISMSSSGRNSGVTVNVSYIDSAQEEAQVVAFINATAPTLRGANTYETVKKVHDFICDNANYDYNTYRGYGDAYGAYDNLILKSSVCQGYAVAFQRYMDYLGIPCYIACGNVDGGPHAWNVVYVDGAWYHIDTTWDGQDRKTRYTYFLLGANTCGYSAWGGQDCPLITVAPRAYGK